MWCTISSTWCKYIQTPLPFSLPPPWNPSLLTKLLISSPSCNWVIQPIKLLTLLVSTNLPSADYAPNIVLTYPNSLGIIHPSLPPLTCNMLFVLLDLERLRMLSRLPKHFRMSRTTPSLPKPFAVALGKLVWRLWWSKNALFSPSVIGVHDWTLLWAMSTGLWRTGSVLFGQMRSKLTALGQMVGSGCGKGQVKA